MVRLTLYTLYDSIFVDKILYSSDRCQSVSERCQ